MLCPACQNAVPDGSNFCNRCGARLAPEAPPQRDPRSYTPRHLARRILTTRSALEGERKQVTVLFADLKGSVELSGEVDPEDWHRIMDHFFELLARGVHRYEGTINQYTGDGVMALFGAPLAHEDHAARACHAALLLAGELRRYAQELRRERGLDFHVRMGLNSGEVVVGRIGDDLRMDYTAQGHVVGLAARMQQIAEPGRIYATEQTARLVPGLFEFEDLGEFQIKGVLEPVLARSLIGEGAMRTRLDVSRARGFSDFVGREAEMAALEEALERVTKGERAIVGVRAGAGLGKSRLCFELAERCRAQGIGVREAHCVSHGRMVPFLPVLQLLRGYFGIDERDGAETARDKIAGRVVRLDPELARTLPDVFEFLGVPDPSRAEERSEPEARERVLLEVFRRLMHARSEREPAVLLVEDLHWIDGASDRFLADLIASAEGTRTLTLLNFRSEYRAEWMDAADYRELELAPLGPRAVDALLTQLLGPAKSLAGLRERLRKHTGGNPFFVEEMVRELAETGALEGDRGAYRLAQPVDALAMPASVQAVLAARIDRLPEREKRVLQDAAVLGRRVSERALRMVSLEDDAALADSLAVLISVGVLYEESPPPDASYAFHHPLTRQAALEGQLVSRRRTVHRRAARALEQIHADRLDENAALLAQHWEAFGDRLAAARWHRRAALWLGVRHAPQALHHWRSVRALVGDAPPDGEMIELALEALGQSIVATGRLGGSPADVDRLFASASALADRMDDAGARVRLLLHYAHFNGISGRAEPAEAAVAEAEALLDRVADPDLVAATHYVGFSAPLLVRGLVGPSLVHLDRAFAAMAPDADPVSPMLGFPIRAMSLGWRGYCRAMAGRLDEARRDIAAALEAGSERGSEAVLLQTWNCALSLGDLVVEPRLAPDWGRRSLEIAERIGLGRSIGEITFGRACLLAGQPDEALAAFERGLAITRDEGAYSYQDLPFLVAIARAALARGDLAQARAVADEAVALAPDRGFLGADAHTVRALARLAAGEATDTVRADLGAAERLVELAGSPCRRPYLHLIGAELERRRGDEAAATAEREAARRAFAAMGADRQAARV